MLTVLVADYFAFRACRARRRRDFTIIMAFRFRLQFALERARANEALARSVIVDARLVFDETGALLAAVESRIAEVRSAARLGGTGSTASALAGNAAAAEAAEIALSLLRARRLGEVERARAVLARARDVYARAAAVRIGLERLRERRLREYCDLREAAEATEIDELAGISSNAARAVAANEAAPAAAPSEAAPAAATSEAAPAAATNEPARADVKNEAARAALRNFTA